MKGRRPRIQKTTITDIEAYVENCCSKHAKRIFTHTHQTIIEIWVDKHYTLRVQFGDTNGEREGIELNIVQRLIEKSFKHLVYYALKHKDFVFLNYPPPKPRNIRVVLMQKHPHQATLNVVVEYHFVTLKCIEVTIKTAMTTSQFELSDGQYIIALDQNFSTLYLFKRNNSSIITIDQYSEQ